MTSKAALKCSISSSSYEAGGKVIYHYSCWVDFAGHFEAVTRENGNADSLARAHRDMFSSAVKGEVSVVHDPDDPKMFFVKSYYAPPRQGSGIIVAILFSSIAVLLFGMLIGRELPFGYFRTLFALSPPGIADFSRPLDANGRPVSQVERGYGHNFLGGGSLGDAQPRTEPSILEPLSLVRQLLRLAADKLKSMRPWTLGPVTALAWGGIFFMGYVLVRYVLTSLVSVESLELWSETGAAAGIASAMFLAALVKIRRPSISRNMMIALVAGWAVGWVVSVGFDWADIRPLIPGNGYFEMTLRLTGLPIVAIGVGGTVTGLVVSRLVGISPLNTVILMVGAYAIGYFAFVSLVTLLGWSFFPQDDVGFLLGPLVPFLEGACIGAVANTWILRLLAERP